MPVTKMYVTGGPAIVPISSLIFGLEEAAITLPDKSVDTNTIGASAGRPQWSQYEMTAQGGAAQHVDPGLLFADRHDAPLAIVPAADVLDRGLTATGGPVEALLHLDTPVAATEASVPVQMPVAASVVSAGDGASVSAVAPETHDFATVDLAAFRAVDAAHVAPHEAFALPLHEIVPVDGIVPLIG